MFCKKCGGEISVEAKFCPKCGSNTSNQNDLTNDENMGEGNSYVTNEIQNTPENITSVSLEASNTKGKSSFIEKLGKNKKVAIGGGIAVVAIVAAIVFFVFSGGGISKDKVKKDLIGKTIQVGSMNLNLTEDNIKSIEINDNKKEKEMGIEYIKIDGKIEIDNGKVKINAPFKAEYMKLGGKEWEHMGTNVSGYGDKVTVELTEKMDENKIKAELLGKDVQGMKVTEENIKDAKVKINREGDNGIRVNATVDFGFKGEFVDKSLEIICDFEFGGENWKITRSKKGMQNVMIKASDKDFSFDTIKKELSQIAPEGGLAIYLSASGFNIGMDTITDFKEFHVELSKSGGYLITGKIKGNNKQLTYEGDFTGKVEMKGYVEFSVKEATVTLKAPELADLSKSFEKKTAFFKKDDSSKNVILKSNENDFKMDSVIVGVRNPLNFYAFGTLSYGDLKDDKVTVIGKYNSTNGTYEVTQVRSATLDNYDKEYSKEAIQKAIEEKTI